MLGKRNRIILDGDLMRHPNSGLFHYCLNLGNYVNRHFEKRGRSPMRFYIPPGLSDQFEDPKACITERKTLHRYIRPFLRSCRIWHAPFQSGRIFPARHKDIRVLLTIHDLNCLHEDKPARERRLSLQHTQKLIDRSDAIVCISAHCKKDVEENMDTGGKPLYVIHNGTHHVQAPPETPAGYRPGRPFVFAMGYVNRKKNFHSLVSLLQNPEIELLIAGRLDEPDYIEQMIRDAECLGVGDRLKLLGPVPEADKSWYLRNCLAFSLPSLAEGFGAPVVEAMAFGKPLFLAHRTSLPEIGRDVAFYFHSFDADHMQTVFREGMLEYGRNGLAQRIKKRGEAFSWEEKAAEYAAVYESLM